ncbi:hypothetical protein KKC87_02990 [Patescibacteria group bacterium]|nr:hypothetical protein [Patescibacteria group bacterium]
MKKLLLVTISVSALLAVIVSSWPAFAYVMQSSNYRLQQDSVNFGGARGESASYVLEDTAGEVGTGRGESDSYILNAGYQQADWVMSISVPVSVGMTPVIPGITGGTATGSAAVVVGTTNQGGYTLYINASGTPAMRKDSNSFANYTVSSTDPDFDWVILNSDSEFGFSPEGPDIIQKYMDDGDACNTGSSDASDKCWDSVDDSVKSISQTSYGNGLIGTTTTIKFRAESGTENMQSSGAYQAVITMTAVAN